MIAANLEKWFAKVKRPMPWRRRPSPYACWLSEIMMQQTTYAAVLPYYERFLAFLNTCFVADGDSFYTAGISDFSAWAGR